MPEDTDPPSAPFDRKKYSHEYYERNKDRIKKQVAASRRARRTEVNAYHVKWAKRLRAETIAMYGGMCDCCGETEPAFLTIDHADGNGNAHRKEVTGESRRAGTRFYCWLKRQGWPTGFRVRCWNCNSGATMNGGICPHEEARSSDGQTGSGTRGGGFPLGRVALERP